jgi:glycosyltransferase involved in cell wall biosynthesis
MVAAPTRAMLAELGRHYGLPARRSRVLVNGREPSLFPPGEKEPFILTAGRLWDIAKNVAALETVAAGLEWPVYVAGEDQHPEGGKVRHLHSHPLGRLEPDALQQWFSRAAIYALPARYEPFGLSALEAALAGCALVLGDLPSLREVWGDAALFVPPDDTEALAAALRALIRDPGVREDFAARARARALTYTPERMASGYIKAYRSLLEGEVLVEVEEEEVSCVS